MSLMWSPATMLTLSTLTMSTIMALSSTNWMFLWTSMELNLLSFIPIMYMSKTNQEIEGCIKYFLAQALGSAALLTSSMSMWSPYSIMPNAMPMLLIVSILLKLGSAPCHFWFPSVMSSISWMSCMILSTWQKLAPLSILLFFVPQTMKTIIPLMAGMNAIIGGIMGMNQSRLRSVMAYSSIGHLGWMMSFMLVNKPATGMIYFLVYCSLVIPMFIIFNKYNILSSKQLSKISTLSTQTQFMMFALLLSLAGLPPLTGFAPKLLTIVMLSEYSIPLIIVLIAGSLMNLYFYLNIVINISVSDPWSTSYSTSKIPDNLILLLSSGIVSMGLIPLIMYYAMTMFNKS